MAEHQNPIYTILTNSSWTCLTSEISSKCSTISHQAFQPKISTLSQTWNERILLLRLLKSASHFNTWCTTHQVRARLKTSPRPRKNSNHSHHPIALWENRTRWKVICSEMSSQTNKPWPFIRDSMWLERIRKLSSLLEATGELNATGTIVRPSYYIGWSRLIRNRRKSTLKIW